MTSKNSKDFPAILKELRIAKKLSQTELGKMVGVHYSHIGKYEKGLSTPKSRVLQKLAEALEVSTDYLFEGDIGEVAQERLEDQNLLKMFKEIESLEDKDKTIVIELINAFLAKKKIQSIVAK